MQSLEKNSTGNVRRQINLEAGSIVRGYEARSEDYKLSRIVRMADFGCLLQPIDDVHEPDGETFCCEWARVEILPAYYGFGVPDEAADNGEGPTGKPFQHPLVKVGDAIWHDRPDGMSEYDVSEVHPTHLVVGAGEDRIEIGWDCVLLYGHTACCNLGSGHTQMNSTPNIDITTAGAMIPVMVGDRIQAKDGLDGDWVDGKVVSVHPHGVFLEVVEEGHRFSGHMFSAPWSDVMLFPDAARVRLLAGDDGRQAAPNADSSQAAGMKFAVRVGDRVEGCIDKDSDYQKGTVLSATPQGVFVQLDEDQFGPDDDPIAGFPWDNLIIYSGTAKRELLVA